MNTTTDNTMTNDNTMQYLLPEALSYKLHEIQMKRETLDAEEDNLEAAGDWLGQMMPLPKGAEYKGNGAWLYRGRGVFAVLRDGGGKYEEAFDFLAQSERGGRVFKKFEDAFLWLDGVHHGQVILSGE